MTASTWARMLRGELRLTFRSVLIWSVSMAALVALVLAVYPSIRDNHSFDSLYGNLSPTMQALLGGSSLTSATGYLNTQLFAFFLPAVLLVFAISRGAAAVAGEEEQHTLDLLLAQPIRRHSLYLQKSTAILVGITALTVASWIPLAAMDSAVRLNVALSHLTGICLQLGLFCCALALSAQAVATMFGRRVAGIAAVTAYTVVGYILYGLSMTVHPLFYLRPFLLWRWYLSNDPLRTGTGSAEVGVLLAICVAAEIAGILAFNRRDLRN